MKSRWTLSVCFLVLPIGFVAAQTLDSALAFFPMSIGDTWEFASYWGMIAPNQLQGYEFSGITGDTLMLNGKVYRVLRWGVDPNHLLSNPSYYRVDSTTANVYSYSPISGQESLWDSLREGLSHRNQWGMVLAISNEIILGTPTVTKVSGTIDYYYYLSYGFGNTGGFTVYQDQSASASRLIYAKIGGREYGTILAIAATRSTIPAHFELLQNYPNPANPATIIRFNLPQRFHATLTVYNMLGQVVATLVNGEVEAGSHEVAFDGTGLASGVYVYRLRAGEYTLSRKMVFVK